MGSGYILLWFGLSYVTKYTCYLLSARHTVAAGHSSFPLALPTLIVSLFVGGLAMRSALYAAASPDGTLPARPHPRSAHAVRVADAAAPDALRQPLRWRRVGLPAPSTRPAARRRGRVPQPEPRHRHAVPPCAPLPRPSRRPRRRPPHMGHRGQPRRWPHAHAAAWGVPGGGRWVAPVVRWLNAVAQWRRRQSRRLPVPRRRGAVWRHVAAPRPRHRRRAPPELTRASRRPSLRLAAASRRPLGAPRRPLVAS